MRVLVTGGSGFVGGHIARALSAEGHELRLLVRRTSNTSFVDDLVFERTAGDLRQPDTLRAACRGMDAVVHAAAVLRAVNHADFLASNREGTSTLAQAAASADVETFIYISSLAAQGPSRDGQPDAADEPRHPVSVYGRSKAEGEDAALALGSLMRVAVLRPPLVFGPADSGLLSFFQMASRGFAVRLGDGSNLVDAIYGPDLADAVVALLRGSAEGVYAVRDNEGPYSWNDLLASLERAAGRRLWIPSLPAGVFHELARGMEWWATLRGGEPVLDRTRVIEMRQRAWVCDSERLTRETGWRAGTALDEGILATMAWYREQGWL